MVCRFFHTCVNTFNQSRWRCFMKHNIWQCIFPHKNNKYWKYSWLRISEDYYVNILDLRDIFHFCMWYSFALWWTVGHLLHFKFFFVYCLLMEPLNSSVFSPPVISQFLSLCQCYLVICSLPEPPLPPSLLSVSIWLSFYGTCWEAAVVHCEL